MAHFATALKGLICSPFFPSLDVAVWQRCNHLPALTILTLYVLCRVMQQVPCSVRLVALAYGQCSQHRQLFTKSINLADKATCS